MLAGGTAVPTTNCCSPPARSRWRRQFPGLGLPSVRAFRDIADVEAMIAAARTPRAVVIGGGLLGLEAAWGLKRRGMSVALVHLMPTLMERQLDAAAGELLQRDLDPRGIAFFTNGQTEEIPAPSAPRRSCWPTAAGFQPTSSCSRSVSARTSISHAARSSTSIAASWSATTWRPAIRTFTRSANASSTMARCSAWSRRSGIRPRCAARGSPATTHAVYVPPPVFTSLKITGVDVFSAGALAAADDADEEITLHDDKVRPLQEGDPARRPYRRQRALRRRRRRPVVRRVDARQGRRLGVPRPDRFRPRFCRAGQRRSCRRPTRCATIGCAAQRGPVAAVAARRDPHHLSLLRRRLRPASSPRTATSPATPTIPANQGRLCSKGAALGDTLATDGRLLHPQIGGRTASWDEALDLVAANFARTVAEHGPDAVAFYVSGQFLTEDYYVANKLMKGFIGTANIDTNSRLCMASSVAGHVRAFGEDIVPGCYEDIEAADLVVLVGSNTAWCHPVLYQRLAAARERARHESRRDRSAAHRDLRHRRPASRHPSRFAMSRCSPVCCCISQRAALATRHGSRDLTTGFAAALEAARERRAFARRSGGIADVRAVDLARFYRLVRRDRAHRDALFARRQPVLGRYRQGQRDHQLPSRDRPHRPARHGAVLADRPAQCDGRPRGRRARQPARRAYELRRPARCRSRAPLLEGAAHGDAPGPQGGRSVRCGRSTAGSRRCGSSAPIRPPACRAPSACAKRWRLPLRRRERLLADRHDGASPMSCCRRPAGARRTARSPIRSAASRASAPSARRPAKRGRTGGCWPKWRGAWAGTTRLPTAGRPTSSASTPRCPAFENDGAAPAIFDIGALADLSDEEYDRLPPDPLAAAARRVATAVERQAAVWRRQRICHRRTAARASCRRRTGRRRWRPTSVGRCCSTPAACATSGTR